MKRLNENTPMLEDYFIEVLSIFSNNANLVNIGLEILNKNNIDPI